MSCAFLLIRKLKSIIPLFMEKNIDAYLGKTLSSVPLSYNAFLLADLIKTGKNDILFVASNGQEMQEIENALAFLSPQTNTEC